MKTIYHKEFIKYSDDGVAYIPLGTIEWHGEHLPIETDFMVAEKICELFSKKIKGHVLPPIYLGTDRSKKIKGENFIGMDKKLKKKLRGNLYYLKPQLFYQLLESLVLNLINQNYKKIIIITGHGGSKQIEVLEKIDKKFNEVFFLNPYNGVEKIYGDHAGIGETSLFWALYPEEMNKSLKIKIPENDDFLNYMGFDPRKKSSITLGNRILKQAINRFIKEIKSWKR